jgi:hypothetical protein
LHAASFTIRHAESREAVLPDRTAPTLDWRLKPASNTENCSYRSPLPADMPKVQQGDNSRQLKWHQAHKNFHDRYPDYEPPKHRLGLLITTKS